MLAPSLGEHIPNTLGVGKPDAPSLAMATTRFRLFNSAMAAIVTTTNPNKPSSPVNALTLMAVTKRLGGGSSESLVVEVDELSCMFAPHVRAFDGEGVAKSTVDAGLRVGVGVVNAGWLVSFHIEA